MNQQSALSPLPPVLAGALLAHVALGHRGVPGLLHPPRQRLVLPPRVLAHIVRRRSIVRLLLSLHPAVAKLGVLGRGLGGALVAAGERAAS